MVKSWGASGSEGAAVTEPSVVCAPGQFFLSCILWAEALQVLCLCWEAGSWDTSSLGTERRVGSGPRSRGPLSLFPLCLPRPNPPWVYVIRPKWVTVCTPAVWLCLAEGTSLPRRSSSWKGTGGWDPGRSVRCSSLRTPSRLRRYSGWDHSPPEKPAQEI